MIHEVITSIIANYMSKILEKISHKSYILWTHIYKPNTEIRVAFSAIISLQYDGLYLLVRNLHRPETFCPFGGVYKYNDAAKVFLDSIDFRPHILDGKDMCYDIRGFIPRKNLGSLLKWYHSAVDRESYTECLQRELEEEFAEAGIPLSTLKKMQFRHIRSVEEKPRFIESENYYQFRIFEAYEIISNNTGTCDWIDKLKNLIETNRNLLLATTEEIKHGRSKTSQLIGGHTHYLINHKRYRGDDPMFNSR